MTNNLRRAMDTEFSGLRVTQRQRAEILESALEGRKVKRNVSWALVLAVALMCGAAVALAVAAITETGRLMARTEWESGSYGNWPAEKRVQVVGELMDGGYIAETEMRRQMREGALAPDIAAQTADEAIAAFTGEAAKNASFLSIMQAAWGPFETWTREQQAWYSRVMDEAGFELAGKTVYVEPTGPVTEQEAVAIAKQEIMRVFGLSEEMLDRYMVEISFQIPEDAESGDTKAWWYVCFDAWNTGMDTVLLPFVAADLFVDPDTGDLREPLDALASDLQVARARQDAPIRQTIAAFETAIGEEKHFMTWSLAHKARWSEEIAPQIAAYVQTHPEDAEQMLNREELASVHHVYGLPDGRAIAQETAMHAALEALSAAYGLSEEELSLLTEGGDLRRPCVFYDVTDPQRPLWKFFFGVPSIYGADETLAARVQAVYGERADYDLFYKAEIDAHTGEVVRTLSLPHMPDSLEGQIDIL